MDSCFKNQTHQERFYSLVKEDGMSSFDQERGSLFYLLTGNEELYQKRSYLYDTKEHAILPCFSNHELVLSSGLCSLIRLGFHLYNNWTDENTTPLSILLVLDEENFNLAQWAMKIRLKPNILAELML